MGVCLLQGDACLGGVETAHDGYCCRWCTSYWNAFLCKIILQNYNYHPQTKFVKVMFLQVCVCPWGGVAIPACIAGGIPACLAAGVWGGGGIPACLEGFQAHTQRGSLGGSGWGVCRPTPKEKVEGDLVQAHSQRVS